MSNNEWKKIATVFALAGALVTGGCATQWLECDANNMCRGETTLTSLAGVENVFYQDLPADSQLPNGGLFLSFDCEGLHGTAHNVIIVNREGKKIRQYTDSSGYVWKNSIYMKGKCGLIDVGAIIYEILHPPKSQFRREGNWRRLERRPPDSWRGPRGVWYNRF